MGLDCKISIKMGVIKIYLNPHVYKACNFYIYIDRWVFSRRAFSSHLIFL